MDKGMFMLFQWAWEEAVKRPELCMLYRVPEYNGNAMENMLQGFRGDMPRICLPIQRKGSTGLYIDMRTDDEGISSEAQKIVRQALENNGYRVIITHTLDETRKAITNYLDGKDEAGMGISTYKDIYVKCPYYKYMESTAIICEGITDESTSCQRWKRKDDKEEFMKGNCMTMQYFKCPICEMLDKKNDDEK